MTTRAVFYAEAFRPPASNPAQLVKVNGRFALAFDATTQEGAYFETVAPQGITGSHSAILTYMMASATSGGVRMQVSAEAVSSGDALDLDASTSFDTANGASDTGVPATAGYMEQITVTLTNIDGVAAGDIIRFFVERVPGHADDTAAGDLYLLSLEWRDGA